MGTKTKTAVDWLVKEISAILGPIATKPMQDLLLDDAIKKAKELEKQQAVSSYNCGYNNGQANWGDGSDKTGEDYFNETYGGGNE